MMIPHLMVKKIKSLFSSTGWDDTSRSLCIKTPRLVSTPGPEKGKMNADSSIAYARFAHPHVAVVVLVVGVLVSPAATLGLAEQPGA